MGMIPDRIDWDVISDQMSSVEVGRRISELRGELGMSIEGLAEKFAKSSSTVSRIERGTQELTLEQLYTMADILNVSCLELLEG